MSVGKTPKGYRDVYWCTLVNEPVIIRYRLRAKEQSSFVMNSIPYCDLCDGEIAEADKLHVFICHIARPERESQ